MTNFTELGLAEPILRALQTQGYAQPTPIQTKAIPVALSGDDILGIAQTGTGKTASFVLPILDRLARNDKRPIPKATNALILAPTRELVAQIAENIRKYSKNMRVSVTIIVGGVKIGPQTKKLASGSHIIVATPGRLLDHLNNGHVSLSQTKYVVLDEADHMLDLGFIPDIRRIMKQLPKKRQTSLLSATMPTQIRALAKDFQTDPVEVAVAVESKPIERITQSVRHTSSSAKRDEVTRILSAEDVERAIVFTRTKRGADRVSQHLQKAGLAATAIHGNKSQGQRTRALASFKNGEINIMVATDIAARGIDIDDVSHVVNFELPEVPEAYVHRIGRTARAGRTGTAISLCDATEAKLLRDIEKLIGTRLPTDGTEPLPFDKEAAKAKNARRNPRQATQGKKAKPHRKGQAAGKPKLASTKPWSPMEASAAASNDSGTAERSNDQPKRDNRKRNGGAKADGGNRSWSRNRPDARNQNNARRRKPRARAEATA
ncbi:DEAD/DEAH box helicase [Cohaesibacter gelatinilyticus]|uniref:DEAD-box ATP-dependent RNA helicase RhpA n=1 Tax=Cohaesibacter gelatinilyticus TaxID=372072 RepID=A0A285PMX8_9HYPH|nr:DEAD/DEAH box helicase [Cohaesibacter gelatinilyticus]SNZ21241.1 ATP-dependent RNA helicase RhlE [Cohaesibacter gelatinilyticus]